MEILTDEITTNLAGPILMTQTFLPHILLQKNSAILNVTSGIAYFPFDKAPLYSASKLGLHSYTQSLRKQLKKTNVKILSLPHHEPISQCLADQKKIMHKSTESHKCL